MARDPERIPEILALIQDAWELNTDARFFQMLYNVFRTSDGLNKLYNVEDWQVEQCLAEFIRNDSK